MTEQLWICPKAGECSKPGEKCNHKEKHEFDVAVGCDIAEWECGAGPCIPYVEPTVKENLTVEQPKKQHFFDASKLVGILPEPPEENEITYTYICDVCEKLFYSQVAMFAPVCDYCKGVQAERERIKTIILIITDPYRMCDLRGSEQVMAVTLAELAEIAALKPKETK
jgi:hypothetical protein